MNTFTRAIVFVIMAAVIGNAFVFVFWAAVPHAAHAKVILKMPGGEDIVGPGGGTAGFEYATDTGLTTVQFEHSDQCVKFTGWDMAKENLGFFGVAIPTTSPGDFIGWIFRLSLGLVGIAALLMLVVGGVSYMLSEVPGVKMNAKEQIANALLGLFIVLGSVLILNTINPELITLKNPTLEPHALSDGTRDCDDKLIETPGEKAPLGPFACGGPDQTLQVHDPFIVTASGLTPGEAYCLYFGEILLSAAGAGRHSCDTANSGGNVEVIGKLPVPKPDQLVLINARNSSDVLGCFIMTATK